MESFSGDMEESTDDIPGRKKSKLKSLKSRLFGRSKRANRQENAKLSQSTSDITAGKGLGSDEDLVSSQGMMGSRALSHDSIFLADQVLTDTEPARVLSQENVHSKIKALQIKLQQQKLHLGPPPMVIPIRRPEDLGNRSEDDSLPHSPLETLGGDITSQGIFNKATPQLSTSPISPIPRPVLTKPVPPTTSSVIEPPLDFSSPAQFTPCLDTSAARHRMSIKPRNQRASTKKRHVQINSSQNNINHPDSVREEQQERLHTQDEVTPEIQQVQDDVSIAAEQLPSKSRKVEEITPEPEPKSSFSQQDNASLGRTPSISSHVLRVKPQKPGDSTSSDRPHSAIIDSEIQILSRDRKNSIKKPEMIEDTSEQPSATSGSGLMFRSFSVRQRVQGDMESTRGINRHAAGPGSFHYTINTAKKQDEERPRSSSFVGMLQQAEDRNKTVEETEEKPVSNRKEKEEVKDLQPTKSPFVFGRLKQEGPATKSPAALLNKRDSLKKVETATGSKNAAIDVSIEAGEEVEKRQVEVEEAAEQEAEREDGKTAFGIKLRSTSQSIRLRSDASSNHLAKPPVRDDQCDKRKRQEISDNVGYASKKLITNTPCVISSSEDTRVTDTTPAGFFLPVKNNLPSTGDPHVTPAEVQTTSSDPREVETAVTVPQETQTTPETASSEMSWMSVAMLKTKSLQKILMSRLPRDFTGGQTAARPQVQPTTQTETETGGHTQTVKTQQSTTPTQAANQPSSDTVKVATLPQSRSQAQTVKPSPMSVQQKTPVTSTSLSNTSREAQLTKQISESHSHPNTSQSSSQSPQIITWPTQSPLPSTQSETSSQFAQGNTPPSQQSPWSSRSFRSTNQLKSTTTTSSATVPPTVSALGRVEKEVNAQEKEGPSLSARRAVWSVSVSEKAAFLEKKAEWTTSSGTKVELKKSQTEVQTLGESPALTKATLPSKETKPEGWQGVKPAVSNPTKVPERPREERWPRKNLASSLPSSSPTQPSPLQSMSESNQPSWMELAKRKSMAWNDKTMD